MRVIDFAYRADHPIPAYPGNTSDDDNDSSRSGNSTKEHQGQDELQKPKDSREGDQGAINETQKFNSMVQQLQGQKNAHGSDEEDPIGQHAASAIDVSQEDVHISSPVILAPTSAIVSLKL